MGSSVARWRSSSIDAPAGNRVSRDCRLPPQARPTEGGTTKRPLSAKGRLNGLPRALSLVERAVADREERASSEMPWAPPGELYPVPPPARPLLSALLSSRSGSAGSVPLSSRSGESASVPGSSVCFSARPTPSSSGYPSERRAPTPASMSAADLVGPLKDALGAEQGAHRETRRLLELEVTERGCAVDGAWRQELGARDAWWRQEIHEMRAEHEEAVALERCRSESLEEAVRGVEAGREADRRELQQCLATAEVELRRRRASDSEASAEVGNAAARVELVTEARDRYRHEAKEARLTCDALTERCRRHELALGRLRAQAAMGSSAQQSGGGIPRPPTAQPHEEPGFWERSRRRGGGAGSLRREVEAARRSGSEPATGAREGLSAVPENSPVDTASHVSETPSAWPSPKTAAQPAAAAAMGRNSSVVMSRNSSVATMSEASVALDAFQVGRRIGADAGGGFGSPLGAGLSLDGLLGHSLGRSRSAGTLSEASTMDCFHVARTLLASPSEESVTEAFLGSLSRPP